MFLFCLVFAMFCARLFICALWSPAGKGLTSWLSFVVSSVSLSLSHWYPGSGVVLDCIDSWSLHHYLLLWIYLWIALNKTTFVSIFQFSLPKRIKLVVKGWNSLTVSWKTCLSPIYLIQWKKKWVASSITPHHSHKGLWRTWFLKRSLLRLLQLFLSRACITELYLFPII